MHALQLLDDFITSLRMEMPSMRLILHHWKAVNLCQNNG